MHTFTRSFFAWLPLAVVVTCVVGIVYAAVQQDLRQSANDPQIEMAENAARALDGGTSIVSVIPAGTVSLEESLSPFINIYDTAGNPVAGNGYVHGVLPVPPRGVFTAGWRETLEPESGVRIASVVVSYKDGYVLAGRSLREVEIREGVLTNQVFVGWLVTLIATFVAVLFKKKARTLFS